MTSQTGAGTLTVRQLIDALGEVMVRPLDENQPLDAVVGHVVIHDPLSPQPSEPGDLVLAVGIAPDGADAGTLVAVAGKAGAAAVAFRPSGAARHTGWRPTPGPGTAVLLIDPDLAWEQLISLARGLVESAAAGGSEEIEAYDLFSLANTIADLVGGSVVLYDVSHEVLAYSSLDRHLDVVDEVRKGTILGRRTPEDWVQRFERDGVYDRGPASRVVRVEGYADLHTRLRVVVRAGEEVLGEISVAETTTPLGQQSEAVLEQAARLAAPYLVRHRLERDLTRRSRSSALHALLDGRGPVDVHLRELDLPLSSSYAVLGLALLRAHAVGGSDAEGERRRERSARLVGALVESRHGRAVTCVIGSTVYAVLPQPVSTSSERVGSLARHVVSRAETSGVPVVAAVGRTVGSLREVTRSRREVDQVLRVLSSAEVRGKRRLGRSALPLVAAARDVWADIALLELLDGLGEAGVDQLSHPVRVLLRHDAERGTAYVPTLAAYLDAFGDVRAAAAALGLHPNSLRHRLRRLSDIAGLDLAEPVQRLVLALDLRRLPREGRS